MTKSWADAVATDWIRDDIYGYKASDGDYNMPSTLDPWYGYWIMAKISGLSLTLFSALGTPVSMAYAPMAALPLAAPPLADPPMAGSRSVDCECRIIQQLDYAPLESVLPARGFPFSFPVFHREFIFASRRVPIYRGWLAVTLR